MSRWILHLEQKGEVRQEFQGAFNLLSGCLIMNFHQSGRFNKCNILWQPLPFSNRRETTRSIKKRCGCWGHYWFFQQGASTSGQMQLAKRQWWRRGCLNISVVCLFAAKLMNLLEGLCYKQQDRAGWPSFRYMEGSIKNNDSPLTPWALCFGRRISEFLARLASSGADGGSMSEARVLASGFCWFLT